MTLVQAIGAIILRILALYVIVVTLADVGLSAVQVFGVVSGGEYKPADAIPEFIVESAVLVAGFVLLALSGRISRLIAPRVTADGQRQSPGQDELLSIGSFLLGILLLAMYLPGVFMGVLQAAVAQMRDLNTSVHMRFWFDGWLTAQKLVALLIAFWLVLRPAHLAGLYRRLRSAGQGAPEGVADTPRSP